jgi:hypothetical protein
MYETLIGSLVTVGALFALHLIVRSVRTRYRRRQDEHTAVVQAWYAKENADYKADVVEDAPPRR